MAKPDLTMFAPHVYRQRREQLITAVGSGLVLLPGNEDSPINSPDIHYPFRQDSSFLYYFGINMPGLAAIIDTETGMETIYGDDPGPEAVIWTGATKDLEEIRQTAGIQRKAPVDTLFADAQEALSQKRTVHYLPPHRPENFLKLHHLLGIPLKHLRKHVSRKLLRAVIQQRSVKEPREIEQIEYALKTTRDLHVRVMQTARPGLRERDLLGAMQEMATRKGGCFSFTPIVTVHPQILHNHHQGNRLSAGQLLLNDSGMDSPLHYASDITRTFPVGGRFTPQQKEIYNLVLSMQETAIRLVKPGIRYRDIHLESARELARGLVDLGLMRGDPAEIVSRGAHALFFPHGLGHLMGLDTHDMEDLGEDYVGYEEDMQRATIFGLRSLRLARRLKPGFVLTVEPGIYFIPALIDRWKSENRYAGMIDYDAVEPYRHVRGIRIEDDILVEVKAGRVLGPPIPKIISEIEEIRGSAT